MSKILCTFAAYNKKYLHKFIGMATRERRLWIVLIKDKLVMKKL